MEQLQNFLLRGFTLDDLRSSFNLRVLSSISFNDIIDILLVAYIIYRVMKLLRNTSAERLIKGVLVLCAVVLLANILRLTTISYVLNAGLTYGLFAVIVIFQPELRRMLEQLGKGGLSRLFVKSDDIGDIESMINAAVSACVDMSQSKTGALIVCERAEKLGEIVQTGTLIDAVPSSEMIKNIFYPKSPLHDGAMIIRNGRIHAAGCVLPLSGSQNLSRDLGTRHRASVGMSESSDSVVIIVSEETGAISVAIGGMLKRQLSPAVLRRVLESELVETAEPASRSSMDKLRSMWKGGESR